MVGVPRSKGCLNCRKRKVACDQQKPQCQVCLKRRVQCEGYQQFPVVLQWTTAGLKKRERFEEAMPASSIIASSHSPSPSSSSNLSSASALRSRSDASTSYMDGVSDMSLCYEPLVGNLMLDQIQVSCLQTYLPRSGSVTAEVKGSWMFSIMSLQDRGAALSCAFAALSLARIGAVMSDQSIFVQARGQHASALVSLQKDLYDPETAFKDTTLAAMRTLSIYEVSSPPPTTGKTHEEGMATWFRAAGPRRIKTAFALQVFVDIRWSIMSHGINNHKSSILGQDEWLTIPWLGYHKDSLQHLFDLGFRIASLLEQTDLVVLNRNSYARAELVLNCFTVIDELDQWSVAYWAARELAWSMVGRIENGEATDLLLELPAFDDLFEASNAIYYWWFKLVLLKSLISLQSQAGSFDESLVSDAPRLAGALIEDSLASTGHEMAVKIVRSADYLLADNTGWTGPQRLIFPLKEAAQHLGQASSPVFAEAQMALKSLFGRLRPVC